MTPQKKIKTNIDFDEVKADMEISKTKEEIYVKLEKLRHQAQNFGEEAQRLADIEKIKKLLREYIKLLKADLGRVPYSDKGQPDKFASMKMVEVDENINDFFEALNDAISELEK